MIVAVSSGLERRHGQVRGKGFCYGSKVNFNISRLIYSFSQISYRVFIKYCIFLKNSGKFATSPSPALGCYWLYKKLPAIRSDCMLAALR